MKNKFEYGNR